MNRFILTFVSLLTLALLPMACLRPVTPVNPISSFGTPTPTPTITSTASTTTTATKTSTITPTLTPTSAGSSTFTPTPTSTSTASLTPTVTPSVTDCNPALYPVGDYNGTAATFTLNGTLLQQYVLSRPSTIVYLLAQVASLPASPASVFQGIYNDNGSNYPSSLIYGVSQLAVTNNQSRLSVSVPSTVYVSAGTYWLSVGSTDGIVLQAPSGSTANTIYVPNQVISAANFSSVSPVPGVTAGGQGQIWMNPFSCFY